MIREKISPSAAAITMLLCAARWPRRVFSRRVSRASGIDARSEARASARLRDCKASTPWRVLRSGHSYLCTGLYRADALHLRRIRRNCDVRVDQPGPVRIDVHVTVDFRGQLSTRQRYGRNEGTKCGLLDGAVCASRTASAAR